METETVATATAVRERPILFSGEMVRAILEGRKTQARRVVTPQPDRGEKYEPSDPFLMDTGVWGWMNGVVTYPMNDRRCPYGQPGDRLWVREKHKREDTFAKASTSAVAWDHFLARVTYAADGEVRQFPVHLDQWRCAPPG